MKRISGNHRQTGLKDRKVNAPNLAVTWRPQNNLRRRGPDVPAARVYGERIWPVLRVMYLCALDWWRRKPLCIVQKYMRIDLISLIPWSISKPVYTSIRPALPLLSGLHCHFFPLLHYTSLRMNEKNVYIITSPHGTAVNKCWLYLSCGSWSLWPLPFRESMPEDGATRVGLSSLRKRGRLWTYFSKLGDCTYRHICLHKKKINAWIWQKYKRGTRWIQFLILFDYPN